jgi:hypothetical protein
MDTAGEKTREARLRQATERLVEDSSLRDALTDTQAGKLLAWALAQLEREIDRTLELPAEEAAPRVENKTHAVRQVMHLTNKLVEDLPQASLARSREYFLQLVDALCEVDAQAVQVDDMLLVEKMAEKRESMDRETIFDELMTMIRTAEEEE